MADDMHARALMVPCPWCRAERHQPCRNRKTGDVSRLPHATRWRHCDEVPF